MTASNRHLVKHVKQPSLLPLFLFTAAYIAAAGVVAVGRRNGEFLFYIAVMLVLGAAVLMVHRRMGLSQGVLWGLSLWGLAHMAGGLMPVPEGWPIHGEIRVLYSLWIVPNSLKFDQLVHVFGFAVTTWLCWEGLRAIVAAVGKVPRQSVSPTLGMLILCTAAGMGFGALNEIVEFVATLLVPETNVGGYINTGWDLVSNLVGCVMAAMMIRMAQSRMVVSTARKPTPPDRSSSSPTGARS